MKEEKKVESKEKNEKKRRYYIEGVDDDIQ